MIGSGQRFGSDQRSWVRSGHRFVMGQFRGHWSVCNSWVILECTSQTKDHRSDQSTFVGGGVGVGWGLLSEAATLAQYYLLKVRYHGSGSG